MVFGEITPIEVTYSIDAPQSDPVDTFVLSERDHRRFRYGENFEYHDHLSRTDIVTKDVQGVLDEGPRVFVIAPSDLEPQESETETETGSAVPVSYDFRTVVRDPEALRTERDDRREKP
ncbi:hypothetical protein [Halopiger aswanensis]|nr:hypothetical protein [Halopiger aswanensis]